MSTEEHHTTLSELGFHFRDEDLSIINAYVGEWSVTNPEHPANNYWVVDTDGKGHPVSGHGSPAQVLDEGQRRGWQVAYVAPYGHYVEGKEDAIPLHQWILEGRRKNKKGMH
ncbi:MAG: hypothetical protein OWQ59_04935 [Alicyclobacillaceae bacterium]|nr:hypothetical protein [Alicyclobacillaceae bacterium]MCY0896064.1 hypothetical protein [Alicyclobacillaceae bacterium]